MSSGGVFSVLGLLTGLAIGGLLAAKELPRQITLGAVSGVGLVCITVFALAQL